MTVRGVAAAVALVVFMGPAGMVMAQQGAAPRSGLAPRAVRTQGGTSILEWGADARASLAKVEAAAVIQEFPLPGGGMVDLDVERFRVTSARTKFVIGRRSGADIPLQFDPEDVVMLRGTVRGMPGSRVFLSLSDWSSGGTISLGGARPPIALTSRASGDFALGPNELAMFEVTAAQGGGLGAAFLCGTDTSAYDGRHPLRSADAPPSQSPMDGGPIKGLQQIELAVETDYEYFQLFGNLQAAGAYITQLYGQVSDIYVRDVNTRIDVVYVRLWDTPSGLYPSEDPLAEFRAHWNANMGSVVRDVAQYCSGRRNLNAGGVAYLNGICNTNAYSWIGYVAGFFADPTRPHVHNHDIMVAAHELGHNCSAPHTHDMGLDTCDDGTTPPRRGTIMSYCGQTFTGGAANHDLWLHSLQQIMIEDYITTRSCVADDCNGNGIHDAIDLTSGFSADANGNGTPDECEDCNTNGVLDPQDISTGFSEDENGNGTPDECEPDCNGNGVPDDLDFLPRLLNPVFSDNFETDTGWTTEILAATSGAWERGIPVNDPGWEYDPISDSDGSGRCYLTQNQLGNTDVDGGSVRLTSPVLNLSAGGLSVAYDYYLTLTNENGVDRLLVEGNSAGGTGTWVTLAAHTTDGALDWRQGIVTPAMMASAGLAQTGTMRFRFTANDGNPASIVESGLDAFRVGTYVAPVSQDVNANNVPDDCEPDVDNNGVIDYAQIQADMALDLNRNVVLDAYEDCDTDGTPDLVELNQSHNVWVASLDHAVAREYLAMYGTFTRASGAAALASPLDLIITPDRRILVSSSLDHRVIEFAMSGAVVGNLVAAGAGGLNTPAGMTLKPGGRLLVASRGTNSVLEYDAASGSPIGAFVGAGSGGLVAPFGVAFGPNGHLFVSSDDGRVLQYDGSTGAFVGEFVTIAGNGGLTNPRGLLFVPSTGRLLVASYGTDRVLQYNGTTGAFLGQFNKNGTATVLTLEEPTCLRLGPEGNVYVSRTHDHESGGPGALHLTNARIYEFRADNGFLMRAYIQGVNSGIEHPTGFDFVPDAGTDCNNNQRQDSCDIASGFSPDVNSNGIPDECEELCYADCNGSGSLTIADFACFQTKFVAGDPYADCNTSGGLTIADFACFQTRFVQGCP